MAGVGLLHKGQGSGVTFALPNLTVVCKATARDAGILYGHGLKSRLLHFQSDFLLMCLGKTVRMTQIHGPLPPLWETHMKLQVSGFVLAQPRMLQPYGE